MKYEQQLLWIIPNGDYENLEDGNPIFYPFILGNRDHRNKAKDFCEKYGFTGFPEGGSHDDWGRYFTEKGFAVFFNSAVMIDDKYFGGWYLPKQLTMKQIEFVEDQKSFFVEKYNSHPSFFGVCVQPDGDLAYSSSNGFRNLKIEAMISGKAPNNAIDLFYDEISLQKEKLNGIRKG